MASDLMRKKVSRGVCLLIVFLFAAGIGFVKIAEATAGIYSAINFQGKVVEADGTNVADASYDFEFKLYTVGTSGTAIWTETWNGAGCGQIAVASGIFRTNLGSCTALPADFNQDSLYLGVNFNSDGEMLPRIRFTAAPYALNAKTVGGLTVSNTTGTLTIPNATVITFSGANDLSFSTSATTGVTFPSGSLTVVGTGTTQTLTAKTIGSGGLSFSGAAQDILTVSNEDFSIITGTGKVGIGTSTPSSALSVSRSETTTGVHGVSIDFTQANDGDATDINAGLQINMTSSSTQADSLYGINIANLVGGSATEYGLVIGTGWDRGLSVGSSSVFTSALISESVFTIGTGSDTFTFNPNSGPLYIGTARPTKLINLSPEYSGGTLTAFYGAGTDTSITGTATADVETTGANDQHTYYEWSSSEGSLNYYTVAVRVKLPKDFSEWKADNALQVDYATESTDPANNFLDAFVYLSSSTAAMAADSDDNVSAQAGIWTTLTIDDSNLNSGTAPEWDAADETGIIYLRMASKSNNYTRIGDIKMSYSGSF